MLRLFKWLAAVLASMLIVTLIGAKLYLSTVSFSAKVAELASDAMGVPVEFKQKTIVREVFPQIKAVIPSAHLTFDDSGGQTRARINDVTIGLSAWSLLVHRRISGLKIGMDDLSVITNNEVNSQASLSDNVRRLPEVVNIIQEMLKSDFALSIGAVTYINRGPAGTETQKLTELELASSNTGITFNAAITHQLSTFPFDLSIKPLIRSSGEIDDEQLSFVIKLDPYVAEQTTISANLTSEGTTYALTGIKIAQGKNIIEGGLQLSRLQTPKEPPLVAGSLNIKRLDLAEWKTPLATPVQSTSSASSRIFDTKTIGYEMLTQLESDLTLKLGALRIGGQPLVNGTFSIITNDNSLSISSNEASAMGAPLSLKFSGKKLRRNPVFFIDAVLSGIDLTRIGGVIGEEGLFSKGNGNAQINLAYHGTSTRDHAQTLDGEINVTVADAHLTPSFSTWLDKGIASHVRSITTKRKRKLKSSGREIPCMNATIGIQNGYAIAEQSILIETPDNLLISSGYTDLHNEKIRYTFTSGTKKFIDWSPMGMVKYMRIGGTLTKPKVTANEKEVAKKGAMTVVSLFAGPVPGLALSAVDAARKRKKGKPVCRTN